MPIERTHAIFSVSNSNVCPICHLLQDILSRNVHDLDRDFLKWPKVKSKYANRKAISAFLFAGKSNVCHRSPDFHSRNFLELNSKNEPKSNVNMRIERPHVTSYVLSIAMFVLSVTVCEIITYELLNVLQYNL